MIEAIHEDDPDYQILVQARKNVHSGKLKTYNLTELRNFFDDKVIYKK
jgi:hypothetical protein